MKIKIFTAVLGACFLSAPAFAADAKDEAYALLGYALAVQDLCGIFLNRSEQIRRLGVTKGDIARHSDCVGRSREMWIEIFDKMGEGVCRRIAATGKAF